MNIKGLVADNALAKNSDLSFGHGTKISVIAAKYLCIFLVMASLSIAGFYGIYPFGSGMFLALVFSGLPFLALFPLYLVSSLLSGISIIHLLCSIITCVAAIAGRYLMLKFARYDKLIKPAFALLSQVGVIIFASRLDLSLIKAIASAVLSMGFMYVAISVIKPIVIEKLQYKLLDTELIALFITCMIASMGLANFNIYGFPIAALVAAFAIFFAGALSGMGASLVTALCFGLGLSINSYDITYIAMLVFVALISGAFVSAPKILTILSGIIAYIMFVFYFGADEQGTALWVLSIVAGGLIFMVMPKKVICRLKEFYFTSYEKAAVRYMINRNRYDTSAHLNSVSGIFRSIAEVLDTKKSFKKDYDGILKNKQCVLCEHYHRCKGEILDNALNSMLETVFKKGRIAIMDVPDYISQNCTKIPTLISLAMDTEQRRKVSSLQESCEQSARELMSVQMKGAADAIKSIACQNGSALNFDTKKERLLIEELNYSKVVAVSALLIDEDVTLIVRADFLDKKLIESVTGRVLKNKYYIYSMDNTILSGCYAINLKPAPRYEVVFGASTCAKTLNSKNGDSHSFIKIDGNRFMMAICDGMGSGNKANFISETAIGLVESFYKAGFSNEIVLASVNRFLTTSSESDGFSALDICIIDLNSARADIIKLASPSSYIKKKSVVEKIEGESTPLGILETVQPSIYSVTLQAGDIVIMTSDGISDNYEGDTLAGLINNLRIINPSLLTDKIMESTLAKNGNKPSDDATVVAARLIMR